MRIDFVITELFVGGAERCLTELALGLADTGDRVRVFSIGRLPGGPNGDDPQAALVRRLQDADIPVESAGADSIWQLRSAYRQVQHWLTQSRPDVCQTFLFHANVIGTHAAKSAGVEVRVGGLRVAEARPIRCRIERSAVKQMTSVVCVSDAVRQFAETRLNCPADQTRVIPNAVNVSRFASAPAFDWQTLGWPADASVALFVGRLHPQKGIELLRDQIDTIAPSGTSRRLLIVGDGPESAVIDRWIDRIGPHRAQRIAWQSDVAPLMRGCRVLILPSRYEGMPNVVMEAMAAGRPAVCSRVEGSAELFGETWDQQTFEVGDGPSMARLADPLLNDAGLADRVGEANRQRMRNQFSIPTMIDAYRSHYRDLAGRR
ncbi:glycosyltransferase [Rubripirellula lacrimiformis]|nr:glycosyltransferase [Rubripirellula lacrimiformis]